LTYIKCIFFKNGIFAKMRIFWKTLYIDVGLRDGGNNRGGGGRGGGGEGGAKLVRGVGDFGCVKYKIN
jgi:hypothetical protein